MSDRYAHYQRLLFDWPAPRVLRIRMNNPGKLNAADQIMHGELGAIWRDVDEDPDVSAVLLTGAGDAFSAGGDMAMIDSIMNDFQARARNWKEAKDIVYNIINCSKPVVSAIRGPAVGAGPALKAFVMHALAAVPGVDRGTVRVSLDPPAASFACDPANHRPRKLIEAAAPRLAAKRLSLVPIEIDRGPHSLWRAAREVAPGNKGVAGLP